MGTPREGTSCRSEGERGAYPTQLCDASKAKDFVKVGTTYPRVKRFALHPGYYAVAHYIVKALFDLALFTMIF